MNLSTTEPRPTCFRCFRPETLCLCDEIREQDNALHITIVQHPRERLHPINTARLVDATLRKSEIIGGNLAAIERLTARRYSEDHEGTVLLYPGPDAVDISELTTPPREIVVLDGTWHHAKVLFRETPALQRLPQVRFTPEAPSEYRIRKEPRLDYLSTLESIALVLRQLEPGSTAPDELLRIFRLMIDRNLQLRGVGRDAERLRRRSKDEAHRFSPHLTTADAALVYAEGSGAGRRGKEPLGVALELPDGSSRHWWVRTASPPASRLLRHLALSEEEWSQQALPATQVQAELRSALGKRTALAWNASSFSLIEELGVPLTAHLQLKAAYYNWIRYQESREKAGEPGQVSVAGGSLREILERHGLLSSPGTEEAQQLQSPGRLRRRLVESRVILRWLRSEQRRSEQSVA